MKKSLGRTGIVVLWLVGIALIVFLGLVLSGKINLTQQAGIGSGSSLISLSQVDLQSSFAPLNGQVWVYTFRLGGLSQYAKYTVSQSEAGTLYSGSEQPRDTFTLDTSLDEQSCLYDIKQDTDLPAVYSYTVVSWSYNALQTLEATAVGKCGNANQRVVWSEGGFLTGADAICETKKAVAGRFDSPNINSKFTVTVSKNGVVDASNSFQTLFSDGGAFGISGLVGSNVYVNWQGDLTSGKSCPSSSAVIPVYYQGGWTTMGSSNYDTYKTQYLGLEQWIASTQYKKTNQAEAQQFIDVVNTASNNVLSGRNFGTIESASTLSSARAKVTLTTPITYPTITAYIKASWIGIVTPIGKPQINTVTTSCFSSSTDGKIALTVQNIGTEREDFTIDGTCTNKAFTIQNSDVQLSAGEVKTVYIGLSGETSESSLKSPCTLNVRGKMYSDVKSFTACVSGISICDAGKLYCDQKNLMKCNNGGTALALLEACTDTCVYNTSTGIAQCKTPVKPDTCGNGVCDATETKESCPIDCQPACTSTVFGLVPASMGTTTSCNVWCSLGLNKPQQTNVCVKDYVPLVLVILTVLALGGMILYATMQGKKKKGKGGAPSWLVGSEAVWKKKTFWIVLAVLVGLSIFIGYFKYFAWAFIVVLVLAIVFGVVFRGSIAKRIRRKIE